jgi:hypothetical protein
MIDYTAPDECVRGYVFGVTRVTARNLNLSYKVAGLNVLQWRGSGKLNYPCHKDSDYVA